MKIYESAVRKPVSTVLLFVGVMVFGLFSLMNLAVDQYPEIEIPQISVITMYPGANAAEIETNITRVLEDNLNTVSNLKKLTSKSQDNVSMITVEFEYGSDLNEGANEIRDVVNYAAERFITVIPEIEFPGHAVGALASYPWLGCTGEQYEVRQTWDIDDRVFCIGTATTFEIIEGVLEEVLELFPSEYIHIGGDECPTVMWKKCPHCKARMKAERLKRPRRLQNYATARVEKFLNAHGRRLIGWDEILEGDVTPTATIMSWRGAEGGIKAAKMGNHAIMAPTTHCYLDYYQTRDTAGEPLAIGGYLPVEKVYSLDPYEMLTAD